MAASKQDNVAAWIAENLPSPKVHEAFGEEWEIPASMPALLWFWLQSEVWSQERELVDLKFSELDHAADLLGLTDDMQVWAEAGATRKMVYSEVIKIILGYLIAAPSDGDGQGEAQAGTTSATSSRSTSRSSRRTSAASTASSSPKRSKKA